ncbi:MAG: NADP-dependent isocitrate dehydrogenase, partial [Microthrixaceae bacterium]|nr:NADP-dependent isocitrate dehydrogenase [Microthrixaceae bacterium]
LIAEAGGNPNQGLGQVLAAIESLPAADVGLIKEAIAADFANGPALAMVDS